MIFLALYVLALCGLTFAHWYPGSGGRHVIEAVLKVVGTACLVALCLSTMRRPIPGNRRDAQRLDGVVPALWRRLAALLADAAISGIPFVLFTFAKVPSAVVDGVLIVFALVAVVYFSGALIEGNCTVGKLLFGLRVGSLNGRFASKKRVLLRGVIFPGIAMSGVFAGLILIEALPNTAAVVTLLSLGFLLIDAAFLLAYHKGQRSLHDRLAGTQVVVPSGETQTDQVSN